MGFSPCVTSTVHIFIAADDSRLIESKDLTTQR